jgi:hypothetical protein
VTPITHPAIKWLGEEKKGLTNWLTRTSRTSACSVAEDGLVQLGPSASAGATDGRRGVGRIRLGEEEWPADLVRRDRPMIGSEVDCRGG